MVKIFIYIRCPSHIFQNNHGNMHGKYAFSYGIKYLGQKHPNNKGKVYPFVEQHNPVSVVPLSDFTVHNINMSKTTGTENKDHSGTILLSFNESHPLPNGLNPNEHVTIIIVNPKICDINNEKTFTTIKSGSVHIKRSISGLYPRNSTTIGQAINTGLYNNENIEIKKHISDNDSDEIYIDADLVVDKHGNGYLVNSSNKHLLSIFPEVTKSGLGSLGQLSKSGTLAIIAIVLAVLAIIVIAIVAANRK